MVTLVRRLIYFTIPLLLILGLAWRIGVYFVQKQAQEQQRIAVLKAPPVIVVAPVGTRLITSYFDTTGTVQAPFNVNIACKVIGRVTYLKVREGTRIHKGQILAKIDNLAYLAQARQAKAAVVEANHRLVQAQYLTNPTNVNVDTQIGEQVAGVAGSTADYSESVRNYGRQVAAAQQAVNDAQARVKGARSAAAAAQATYKDAKAKYVRNYQLYRQGFVAAQDAEDALAAELVAQNNLETANQTLNSQAAQLQSAQEQLEVTRTTGRATIMDTRSRLAQSNNALQYARSNTAQKPSYRENLAALVATLAGTKQALKNAESNLADTILASPLDGFVTARYVDPGQVLTPGTQILSVAYMNSVWVSIAVPEEVSRQIRVGQPATMTFDALPGRMYLGIVVLYTPAADLTSRQFMARIAISNPDSTVKPGSYSRVSIETTRIRSATAVPREAILSDRSGEYVMVVSGGVAHRRAVVTGASDPSFISVIHGLQPGELVSVSTYSPLRDGQKVKIGAIKAQARADSGLLPANIATKRASGKRPRSTPNPEVFRSTAAAAGAAWG